MRPSKRDDDVLFPTRDNNIPKEAESRPAITDKREPRIQSGPTPSFGSPNNMSTTFASLSSYQTIIFRNNSEEISCDRNGNIKGEESRLDKVFKLKMHRTATVQQRYLASTQKWANILFVSMLVINSIHRA